MLANLGPFTWAMVAMFFAAQLEYNEAFSRDWADVPEMVGVVGLVMIGIFELDPYNEPMKLFHYVGAVLGCGTIGGYVIQGIHLVEIEGSTALIGPFVIVCVAFAFFILWQLSNSRTDLYQTWVTNKFLEEKKNLAKQNDHFSECVHSLSLCLCCKKKESEDKEEDENQVVEVTLSKREQSFCALLRFICSKKMPSENEGDALSKEEETNIRKTITKLSILNIFFEGVFLFCGSLSLGLWLWNYSKPCRVGCA